MSKAGFPFAAPQFIDSLMKDLEIKFLKKYTLCEFIEDSDLALAFGVVHVELIIIHPFRDGNKRVARLLANLMTLQSGRCVLNYEPIDRTINLNGYNNYVQAIHKGFNQDYKMIQSIFLDLLKVT